MQPIINEIKNNDLKVFMISSSDGFNEAISHKLGILARIRQLKRNCSSFLSPKNQYLTSYFNGLTFPDDIFEFRRNAKILSTIADRFKIINPFFSTKSGPFLPITANPSRMNLMDNAVYHKVSSLQMYAL